MHSPTDYTPSAVSGVVVRRFLKFLLTAAALIGAAASARAVPLFKAPAMIFDIGQDGALDDRPYGDQFDGDVADLNGDGRDDIVIPNPNSWAGEGTGNTISVLLANAAPALPSLFRNKVNYTVGLDPVFARIVDVNNDTKRDVIAMNGVEGTITTLFGNGTGTLGGRVDSYIGTFNYESLVGDVNGDGFIDVVSSRQADDTTSVFLGTGTGSFTIGPVSANDYEGQILFDINGDGRLDLVGGRGGLEIRVGLGNGNGTFQPPIISPSPYTVIQMAVGNFDAGTVPDLVVTSFTDPAVLVHFHGLGNGFFTSTSSTTLPDRDVWDLAARDMDGNGLLDVVATVNRLSGTTVGEGVNTVLVLIGDGTGNFPDWRSFDGGGSLTKPLLGDFDGNGLTDIAAPNAFDFFPTNPSAHALSVLRNLGGWEFGGGLNRPTLNDPMAEAIADINRDGIPDLIVAGNNAQFEIHLGDGFGGFSGIVIAPTTPSSPGTFAVGDLNRDGKLDLVAGSVNLLYGNGDGTFMTGGPIGSSGFTVDESLADLNRDGTLDLLLLGGTFLKVALGLSAGTFGAATTYSLPTSPNDLTVADWNRDGKLDVAVATLGGINIFLGNGDGTLAAPSVVEPFRSIRDVTSGDFNGDGLLDLASRDGYDSGDGVGAGGASVFLGDGAGGFGARVTTATFDRDGREIGSWDVNRDGSLDLVATSRGDLHGLGDSDFWTARVLLGNGTGAFVRDSDYLIGLAEGINRVAFGDLNLDGQTDIVGRNVDYVTDETFQNYLSILRGGMGSFTGQFAGHNEYATDQFATDLVVTDFNRDGRLDVAVGAASVGRVSMRFGNGTGGVLDTGFYTIDPSCQALATGDLDRDGDADLVSVHSNGNACVLLNTGTGAFGPTLSFPVGSDLRDVALGDLNRDGLLDMVTSSTGDGTIIVRFGTGGSFGPPMTYFPVFGGIHIALGDLNRDGALDVVADDGINAIILLNTGNGTLGSPTAVLMGLGIRDIELGDLNRDGKLDVVASRVNSGVGSITVGLGNGAGGFGPMTHIPCGSDVRRLLLADPYGDGILDVVVANGSAGTVSVFRGNGDGSFQSAATYTAHSVPVEVAMADLDRDGRPDLVTANSTGNNLSILLGSDSVPTGVAAETAPAIGVQLSQNSPNPFNPRTAISFALPAAAPVQLRVFDVAGRLVTTLADGPMTAGPHRVVWDGRSSSGEAVASGVYFYRLEGPGFQRSKRMALLK